MEFLAALTGILIAIQARANGQLSYEVKNSIEAALISFGSGLIAILVIALFSKPMQAGLSQIRIALKTKSLPKWPLIAGALGGCVIGIQTHVVPLLGVAIYSVASISGQTGVSLIVDRLGLTGGIKQHISMRRILAALVTITAVLVSVWDQLSLKHFALVAVVVTIIAGSLIGVQRAFNGQINSHSHQSFATSLINFIMGSSVLALTLLFVTFVKHERIYPFPHGPWWIYTGGVTGVIYIAFASTVVQHLGVLTFTLFSVGGQLLGSLLIDFISPTSGTHISWYLIVGIAITYVGVIIGGQSRLFRR